MSEPARILAWITSETPWGAAAAGAVQCSYCHEAIEHDGEVWRHVRTCLSADWRSKECHPICLECDQEGIVAVGAERFVGSGVRFVVSHFLCREYARRGAFIERT